MAVKQINLASSSSSEADTATNEELHLLTALRHPHTIRFFGAVRVSLLFCRTLQLHFFSQVYRRQLKGRVYMYSVLCSSLNSTQLSLFVNLRARFEEKFADRVHCPFFGSFKPYLFIAGRPPHERVCRVDGRWVCGLPVGPAWALHRPRHPEVHLPGPARVGLHSLHGDSPQGHQR